MQVAPPGSNASIFTKSIAYLPPGIYSHTAQKRPAIFVSRSVQRFAFQASSSMSSSRITTTFPFSTHGPVCELSSTMRRIFWTGSRVWTAFSLCIILRLHRARRAGSVSAYCVPAEPSRTYCRRSALSPFTGTLNNWWKWQLPTFRPSV